MPTTLADLTAACGEKILNPDFLLQGGGQPFAEQQKLNNQHDDTTNGTDTEKKTKPSKIEATTSPTSSLVNDNIKSSTPTDYNNMSNMRIEQSIATTSIAQIPTPTPVIDEEDPLHYMFKRPVITLYSQKMKGLKDLLLAEKLNTHAISLQVTAQSVASKKIRGVDKLGNHTTISTYSTVNISSTTDSSTAGDSIAVSRPKRTRRE